MSEEQSERKIAVIFATDVVGYSASIEKNENQTLRNLKDCRKILDTLLAKHKGRIFNTAGDSVLAEFNSAVSAVECSTQFQDQIRERNASSPDEKKMEFRIGIHIGDVVIDGDNLYGEGVNIAARLESFCQPNGLCISKSIFDLIKGRTENEFNDLDIQKIKNSSVHSYDLLKPGVLSKRKITNKNNTLIYGGISALIILIASFTFYYLNIGNQNQVDIANNKKMLVLPFEVRSSENSYDYLSQGTLEYLVSNLTGVKLNNEQSINIISTSLSNSILKENLTNNEILKTFGANYILRGSIQISNDDLRINAELTDVSKEEQVWSQTKNSKLDLLFKVQDELALDLLSFLGFGNQSTSRSGIMGKVKSPEEMRLLLKIIKSQRKFSKDAWRELADLTNQFFSINPEGAVQNIMKAWEYNWKVAWGVSKNKKEDLSEGLKFADKAIQISSNKKLNPQDSYVVKAFLLMSSKDHESAIEYAEKAKRLIVNNPEAWGGIGVIFFFCNEFQQAIEAFEFQSKLVMEQQLIFKDILVWSYIFNNKLDDAKRTLNEILLKKNHPNKLMRSQVFLSLSYIAYLENDEKLSNYFLQEHLSLKNKTTIAGFIKFKRFKDISVSEKPINYFISIGVK